VSLLIAVVAIAVGWMLVSILCGLWLAAIMRDPHEDETAGPAREDLTSLASATDVRSTPNGDEHEPRWRFPAPRGSPTFYGLAQRKGHGPEAPPAP
jgi:hypothetical protein